MAVPMAAVLLACACAGPTVTGSAPTSSPTGSSTTIPTGIDSPAATLTTSPSAPAVTPSPAIASATPGQTGLGSCARTVLSEMTLDQQIGQLFLVGLVHDKLGVAELRAIRSLHVGSVWFTARTTLGVAGVRAITDAVQAEATSTSTAGVEFLVAANQEGGLIQALRGPGFSSIPTAVVQGQLATETLKADARKWAQQLLAAGVNLNFAPVADVVPPGADATNEPIGVLRREYGHDPDTAGSHAAAFVAGMTEAGVATTAKHFPGLGRVVGNTDFTAGVVDATTTTTDPYLAPFRSVIDAGVPFVMVSLATYSRIDPDHLAVFSPLVIQGLLRRDLGFTGVVVSDDLGTATAIAGIPAGERAVDFLLAGGDMIITSPSSIAAMVSAVKSRATADPAFAARVDDAALRVLEAKGAAGLLPCTG